MSRDSLHHHQRSVLVSGSHGLVASRLIPVLEAGGYRVVRLVRRPPGSSDEVFWNPESGAIDSSGLEGIDAVIHLAGASIAAARWTAHRKEAIRSSRVNGTTLLANTLAMLHSKPRVFVSTSAVGYYGDRGNELLTEESSLGSGFLAAVCRDWELSAISAAEAGIRVVHPRFGVVVAGNGGMIPLLTRLFRIGLGGRIGSGRQYMAWIGLDDLVRVLFQCVSDETLNGPVNAVGPELVTNSAFTTALGSMLHRPTFMSVPAAVIRVMLGEMAEDLILASQRVVPDRLSRSGFEFSTPTMERALRAEFSGGETHTY